MAETTTPTLPFAELPLYVGRSELVAGTTSQPHRHPHTELALALGPARLEIDLDVVTITEPSVVTVRPGTGHRWVCDDVVTLWVVGLKAGVLGDLDLALGALPPGPHPVPTDELDDVVALLRLARRRFNDDPRRPGPAVDLVSGLVRMVLGWATPGGDGTGGRDRRLAREFLAALEADGGRARSVTVYASRLGLSPGHLTSVVSASLGRAPKELIADRLVNEAKRLLVVEDLGAAAVAHQLGFSDPSHFGRWFRRHTGVTPGRFRVRA